ncbi:MAG: hypothetical protein JF617_02815 [Burkholderiales bacterium]|nr:hypothetical protein [Burkholderiales bacterium]
MPQASSISVLVVDDQLTMRALIRNALQQIGFKDIREAPFGVNNYCVKPFTVQGLKEKIEQVFGQLT